MIKRIFIANRGEIVQRIARTAKTMGLQTVCCQASENPPLYLRSWVTDFVRVSEESSALYLDKKKMVELAKQSSCDAIHPGFGFLSENAEFAALVLEAGLTWIGPEAKTISLMADKDMARSIAQNLEVPCTKGIGGLDDLSIETLGRVQQFAEDLGFPLLVKASLGGGGKGMRVVREAQDLQPALERARSEALNSFGSGSLIIEQFIESSRHVEVQVLCDMFGETVIIGDRDCSLQRRHQKIIEESPAPFIQDEIRDLLHDCAKRLAKHVDYRSAGTVEFMLSQDPNNGKQEIFFLEMNTRLQVEHTVSEEVFGLDLVAAQIHIANGQRLGDFLDVARITPRGHSFEARLYCEDPENNFFPSPGRVYSFLPYHAHGVRWELGIDCYDEITGGFDPMFAKVIATASSRVAAAKLLQSAISQTIFFGPKNNREFLITLLSKTDFSKVVFDTDYVDQNLEVIKNDRKEHLKRLQPLADISFERLQTATRASSIFDEGSQIDKLTRQAFSLANDSLNSRQFKMDELIQQVVSLPGSPDAMITFGSARLIGPERLSYELRFARTNESGRESIFLLMDGMNFSLLLSNDVDHVIGETDTIDDGIRAKMPGKVVKVICKEGELVVLDEVLFVLESMKMEFEVNASTAGKIGEVLVSEGDQVNAGQPLAKLES